MPMEFKINYNRLKIFSGSALKLIACLSMLCDHLAKCYLKRFAWFGSEWFSVGKYSISVQELMLAFGRFAFPLFAFLLVIGFENTRNKTKYGISLFIFALLSEIPFNLMIGKALHYPLQNVMFTLLLGYLAMWALSCLRHRPLVLFGALMALFVTSRYLNADYGATGFVFMLLMYGLRKEKILRCVAAPFLLMSKLKVILALSLTLLYNGQRGFIKTPFLKYCFYAFYPVHMLVIYWLSQI